MSEMVERVARACHDARIFVTISDTPAPYNETSPNNRYLYKKLARAAIAAMREPTEAMRKQFLHDAPTHVYQLMIDAALKD